MKKISRTVFVCNNCGYETHKWMGRCPGCSHWHTLVEKLIAAKSDLKSKEELLLAASKPVPINSLEISEDERILTGINEFDRVIGGGLVSGSLILIGGDPGIGKSTLILQSLHGLSNKGLTVLYVSGEESPQQIKMRSERLAISSSSLLILSETDLAVILQLIENDKPDVLVIDSIQTMFNRELASAPGSVSQVRESTMRLMIMSKKTGIPTFLIGHVTKDGAIAGPRILEHMVDTVLYFEGNSNYMYRTLRTVKNRFGSTNEIGVFEMKEHGLEEVTNPSALFLSERPENSAGSVVTASMEGSRPILVELQGLACHTNFGTPRRTILGLDQNRVALLAAVMEKILGMHLTGYDIFMNVAGGVKLDEPAVDLGIVSAIASSFLDKAIDKTTVVLGEVGLTGEVRGISKVETRIAEIKKMGFKKSLIPGNNLKHMTEQKGIELTGINNISEAIDLLF